MMRSAFNWSFRDVANFLKDHGFVLRNTEGSHFFYIKKDSKTSFQVCVPFHGGSSIKPRTLKSIILQSGIPKGEWLK
jgi:predicted RNA binding protein YcfA (HicA-like mRNA interferase family)